MNDDFFNKENNMKVAKNTVVSIAYQVRTQDGVLAVSYTHLDVYKRQKEGIPL